MKGLICDIYQNPHGNCSNHGISSWATEVLLVADPFSDIDLGIPEIFEESSERPTVIVRTRKVNGVEYLRAVPITIAHRGSMMGGGFIWTSDSRFPAAYPIPLHDRQE
jgi:hypothetical protein